MYKKHILIFYRVEDKQMYLKFVEVVKYNKDGI